MIKNVFFLTALGLLLACQPSAPAGQADPSSPTADADSLPALLLGANAPQEGTAAGPIFDTGYLMGKFVPEEHPDFTKIESRYADREGLYLRRDAYEAFLKMQAAAEAAGFKLVIRSATRNFDYQKGIWERKWTGAALSSGENAAKAYPKPKDRALHILRYSSMPGTSRHHWGTDIDFNSFDNAYFEQGEGLRLYEWLTENGPKFGFCQPYTAKGAERPYGYNEEKWHWSYLPISRRLTELAREALKDEMIAGFKGAEAAAEISVVERYVLGISENCK